MKRSMIRSSQSKPLVWRVRFDMAIRAALGLFFALSAGLYFHNAFAHWHKIAGAKSWFMQAADGFSIFAIGLYTFMIACLYALRLRPVNKFAGIKPAITAIMGGFLVAGLLFLPPRADLPLYAVLTSIALIIIGNLFAVIALSHLGRSFSILPESRKLVMSGPYRFVRHPLYVAEAIATLGAMINFLSPAAVALVAAQFLLQLGRIHYEEKTLRANFPAYTKYSTHTARLVPGLY